MIATWVGIGLTAAAAFAALGYQIIRDMRRDRRDNAQAATQRAVQDALLAARVDRLELERAEHDDDD